MTLPLKQLARLAILLALLAPAGWARAQGPFVAPPPNMTPADTPVAGNTLWHSLGIPQGFRKVEDATVNANGNHPEDERIPPLKRIGDPSNLQSSNPAIKKAAEIKEEEDQKQQKIKAIKYLATVGCCSYKGVIEALADALEDPTEEVRFEAAQAIVDLVCYNSAPCVDKPPEDPCKHSFHHDDDGPPGCIKKCLDKLKHCAHLDKKEEKHIQCKLKRKAEDQAECGCGENTGCACNKCGGCCSEELVKKLSERAFGRDEKGCLLEPSERVRAMEKQALCCCCPGGPEGPPPGTPVTPPIPVEVPTGPRRTPESVPPSRPEIPGPGPAPLTPPPPTPDDRPGVVPPPPTLKQPEPPQGAAFRKPQIMVRDANGNWTMLESAANTPAPTANRGQVSGTPGTLAPVQDARSLSGAGHPLDVADALLPAPPADFEALPNGTVVAGRPQAVRTVSSQIDAGNNPTLARPAVVINDPAASPRTGNPSPAMASSAAKVANAPASTGSLAGQLAYGKVAEVDVNTRSVLLSFARGAEPAVGTTISVHHNYLLGPSEVGVLEVVTSRPGTVIAQPAGTLALGKISREDEVVYRRAQ